MLHSPSVGWSAEHGRYVLSREDLLKTFAMMPDALTEIRNTAMISDSTGRLIGNTEAVPA